MGRKYVPYVRRHLARARGLVKGKLGELSVGLVNDAVMGALHERFMGIAGPTDVLTFELEHDERGRVTSGEVIICVPEARRRAKEHGIRAETEVLLYAIHGMLHLCGFDDKTDAGYRAMHRKEDSILIHLGIGAAFSPQMGAGGRGRFVVPSLKRKR